MGVKPYIPYEDQLKDPRWLRLRARVMDRDGHKCKRCRRTHNLQVHHLRYKKGAYAWQYRPAQLETLCGDCHYEEHRHKIAFDKFFDQ